MIQGTTGDSIHCDSWQSACFLFISKLHQGGLLKWKSTCLPERTPLKVLLSYEKQNKIKKRLVGAMIAGTYHTFFIIPELDNLQTCKNFIPWELIEIKTWLTFILTRIYAFYLVFHGNYSLKCCRKKVISKIAKLNGQANKKMLPRGTCWAFNKDFKFMAE